MDDTSNFMFGRKYYIDLWQAKDVRQRSYSFITWCNVIPTRPTVIQSLNIILYRLFVSTWRWQWLYMTSPRDIFSVLLFRVLLSRFGTELTRNELHELYMVDLLATHCSFSMNFKQIDLFALLYDYLYHMLWISEVSFIFFHQIWHNDSFQLFQEQCFFYCLSMVISM